MRTAVHRSREAAILPSPAARGRRQKITFFKPGRRSPSCGQAEHDRYEKSPSPGGEEKRTERARGRPMTKNMQRGGNDLRRTAAQRAEAKAENSVRTKASRAATSAGRSPLFLRQFRKACAPTSCESPSFPPFREGMPAPMGQEPLSGNFSAPALCTRQKPGRLTAASQHPEGGEAQHDHHGG